MSNWSIIHRVDGLGWNVRCPDGLQIGPFEHDKAEALVKEFTFLDKSVLQAKEERDYWFDRCIEVSAVDLDKANKRADKYEVLVDEFASLLISRCDACVKGYPRVYLESANGWFVTRHSMTYEQSVALTGKHLYFMDIESVYCNAEHQRWLMKYDAAKAQIEEVQQ